MGKRRGKGGDRRTVSDRTLGDRTAGDRRGGDSPGGRAESGRPEQFRLGRALSLIITFFTGASALVYEVTWQRYLANFLGSQAQATAIILAVFLGGLCAGYLIFGAVSRERAAREVLRYCGFAEVGIGVWVMLFPAMYRFLWQHGTLISPESSWSHPWEIGVSALLLGVPTILMGGTLPLLTQGLSRDLDDAAPFHARVYAVNTAGAFVGCLAAGFFLLPAWGLTGTLYRLGPLNVAGGVLLLLLAQRVPPGMRPQEASHQAGSSEGHLSPWRAVVVAFIAGYTSLTLQTLYMRVVGLSMGTSEYTFCMVVAVFVAMLAWGSWRLASADRAPRALWINQAAVFLGSIVLYGTVSYWPYCAHVIRCLFATVPPNFYVYHAAMFVVLALALAFPVGAMGATMPLLFGATKQNTAGLGSLVGRLYAWNTVGCALGALLGGYALLAYGNMDWVFRHCLVLMGISLVIVLPRRPVPALGNSAMIGAALLATAAVWLLPDWNHRYLGNGLFRIQSARGDTFSGPAELYKNFFAESRFLYYRDGTNTTVVVAEQDASESGKALNEGATYTRNMKVNGKSDGETSFWDTRTMRLAAHLPVLLSRKPVERAAVIGFGLGVSAGTLTQYPEVKDVHVVEISPAVKEAAPFFDFANYGASQSPKLRWSVGDAYRVLGATDERFDVIISEPSNPWVVGVERLFSQEFYGLVKAKLAPGGIYSQWIHDYTLSEPTWGLVMNTFSGAFPYVRVFRIPRDTIILGSMEPIDDEALAAFERRYDAIPFVRESLKQITIADKSGVLGLELWIRREQFPGAELQTLEFPKLAHRAGWDFFLGEDVNMTALFDGNERRLWARAYAAKSLIVPFLRAQGQNAEVVRSYAESACDTKVANFFQRWKSELKPCRDSLVALGVMGAIQADNGIRPEELNLLRRLRTSGSAADLDPWRAFGNVADIPGLHNLYDLFGSYDSEFLNLSPERLLLASAKCLDQTTDEALQCRAHLVETLAVTLHPEQAAEVLRGLMAANVSGGVGAARMKYLTELVDTSLRATS